MNKILIVVPDFRKNKIAGNVTSFTFLKNIKYQNKNVLVCSFITKKTNLYSNVKYFLINIKSICNFYFFIKKNNFDIIYLNSFFSFYNSILIVLIFKIFIKKKIKICISPRGELLFNQINKSIKKILFIKFFKFVYSEFFYIASNNFEKKSIMKILNVNRPYIYNDIFSRDFNNKNNKFPHNKILKIIFLSRINKHKNLLFIIQTVKSLKIKLIFDIYGPIEDLSYWNKCKKEIDSLPNNISINYNGVVPNTSVQSIFFKYDLFCFPSPSENFGNVIYESLSAGTPVLCNCNLNHIDNIKSNYSNLYFIKKIKYKKEQWKNEILKFSKLSIKEKIKIKKKLIKFYKNEFKYDCNIYYQNLIKVLCL